VLNRPAKKAVPPPGGVAGHKTIATKPFQINLTVL